MELFKKQGVYYGRATLPDLEELKKMSERDNEKKMRISFGKPGEGHGIHPWDKLKPCSCGSSMTPWIFGLEDGREADAPYYIRCLDCGKSTGKGTLDKVITEWNSR